MNIVRFARFAFAASALGFLCSGCATSFDPANAERIHTVAIKPVEEPTYKRQVRILLNAGADDFSGAMRGQNLQLGAEVKAAIAQALRDDGYTVQDQGTGSPDAVLAIVIGGAPPNFAPMYEDALSAYEPEYSVKITLRDAATDHVLYDRFFVYRDNSLSPMDGSMLIRPDKKYFFTNDGDLDQKPALAAEGFRAPIPTIAKTVGDVLKKR